MTQVVISLNLPANPFELLDKSNDFLKYASLFGQVLRVSRGPPEAGQMNLLEEAVDLR